MSRCSSPRAWLVTSSVSLRRPGPSAATSRTTGGPAVAERVAGSAPTAPSALAKARNANVAPRKARRVVDLIPVSYTHLTLPDEEDSVDLGGRRIIKKTKPL